MYARQESPSAFQHGAKLLLKDVLLLESAVQDQQADQQNFLSIRDLTLPFIQSIADLTTIN